MSKVLLLSAGKGFQKGKELNVLTMLLDGAKQDKMKAHLLTDDPYLADIIIFAESDAGSYYEFVRWHQYVKKFREKCLLVADYPIKVIPFLPGVYPTIEKSWYNRSRVRSGFYFFSYNDLPVYDPGCHERPFLFSFMGAFYTHPIREKVATLKHKRGYIVDTKGAQIPPSQSGDMKKVQELKKRYFDSINKSKFVLCPRGVSCSSMRLFETMMMGRVPVIISDEWVEPEGPRWKDFSIRIAEKDIKKIPELLETYEDDAAEMGISARKEWERCFSKDVYFHTIVEWCLDMKKNRKIPESLHHYIAYIQLLRPYHFKNYLKTRWHLFKEYGRIIL